MKMCHVLKQRSIGGLRVSPSIVQQVQKTVLLSKVYPRKTNEFVGIKIILKISPVGKLYLSLRLSYFL